MKNLSKFDSFVEALAWPEFRIVQSVIRGVLNNQGQTLELNVALDLGNEVYFSRRIEILISNKGGFFAKIKYIGSVSYAEINIAPGYSGVDVESAIVYKQPYLLGALQRVGVKVEELTYLPD